MRLVRRSGRDICELSLSDRRIRFAVEVVGLVSVGWVTVTVLFCLDSGTVSFFCLQVVLNLSLTVLLDFPLVWMGILGPWKRRRKTVMFAIGNLAIGRVDNLAGMEIGSCFARVEKSF